MDNEQLGVFMGAGELSESPTSNVATLSNAAYITDITSGPSYTKASPFIPGTTEWKDTLLRITSYTTGITTHVVSVVTDMPMTLTMGIGTFKLGSVSVPKSGRYYIAYKYAGSSKNRQFYVQSTNADARLYNFLITHSEYDIDTDPDADEFKPAPPVWPSDPTKFQNEQGTVTVDIDGLSGKQYDIIGCQVQTAEGTENILTPCIYTAATIRILTAETDLYAASLVGSRVTITAPNFYWRGKIVTNCANMDYNQDREEIEIQAVDDLTLMKSEEYKGPSVGTVIDILRKCLPDDKYIMCGSTTRASEDWSIYPRPPQDRSPWHTLWEFVIIPLAALMPKDSSEKVMKADILEAVLRYFSMRCYGYAARVVPYGWPIVIASHHDRRRCRAWEVFGAKGDPGVVEYLPKTENISPGGATPYRGTAQVSLLEPYKSYKMLAHFPSIEMPEEAFEECGRVEYRVSEVPDNNTWETKRYGWKNKYRKSSFATYNRYTYVNDIYPLSIVGRNDPFPTLAKTTTPATFDVGDTDNREQHRGWQYACGAIHVQSAYGEVVETEEGDETPAGVPSYADALMLYGLQALCTPLCNFSQKTGDIGRRGPYTELYRHTLPAYVISTNNNPIYLVVNGSLAPMVRHFCPFYNTIPGSWDFWGNRIAVRSRDDLWRIPCRLYCERENGQMEVVECELAADMANTKADDVVWQKSFPFVTNVRWSDNVDTDGAKFVVPAGRYRSIGFGIGVPDRVFYNMYTVPGADGYIPSSFYSAYIYLTGLEFSLEYKAPLSEGDTDTEYGWTNDGFNISGNEVEEKSEIVTADGKNLSNNIVSTADSFELRTVSVFDGDLPTETDRPEALRVGLYARQYADSTVSMTTTLGGAPRIMTTFNTKLKAGMTIEAYVYDLSTGLTEVTLVENKL